MGDRNALTDDPGDDFVTRVFDVESDTKAALSGLRGRTLPPPLVFRAVANDRNQTFEVFIHNPATGRSLSLGVV